IPIEKENRSDTEASRNSSYKNEVAATQEASLPTSTGLQNVFSPITGKIVKLSEVSDPTFSQELMGKGIAINPEVGRAV
ncbi:PTS glucose transporter subunit IIA, partial [Streptomyces caeruleatus]